MRRLDLPGNLRAGLLWAVASFAVLTLLGSRLTGLENALTDLRFTVRAPRPLAPEIALVLDDSGGGGMSSPQAARLARLTELVERLHAAEARVVVFDLPSLASPSLGTPAQVASFAAGMRASGNVVLPLVVSAHESAPVAALGTAVSRFACPPASVSPRAGVPTGQLVAPPAALSAAAGGLGCVNAMPERGRALRRAPLVSAVEDRLYPALALEAVRVYLGLPPGSAQYTPDGVVLGDRRYSTPESGELLINFAGGYFTYPAQTLSEVLRITDTAELARDFGGKMVLVEPSAEQLADFYPTLTAPVQAGIEINAHAISNLLHEDQFIVASAFVSHLFALLCALLTGVLVSRMHAVRGAVLTAILGVATFLFIVVAFHLNIVLEMARPLLCIALTGGVVVMQNAALADRQRARVESALQTRLQAIASVGRLVGSSLDRDELLQGILQWVEREIGVTAASILTLDGDTRKLTFEAASGAKANEVKRFTLDLGEGIAGTVAASGEPLVVEDAAHDPRQQRAIAQAIDFPVTGILAVPMTRHGEVVGVLEAMNKGDGTTFTDYDVSLLTAIGQQAALSLENARLYAELQERVDFANAELRVTNAELAAQKANIETLVNQLASGVIATDLSDGIVLFNQVAEKMLGIARADVLGRSFHSAISDPKLTDLFSLPLSEGESARFEDFPLAAHPEIVVRGHIVRVVGPGGTAGKVLLLTDITQFIELDQMKNDLVSFVSHELKQPLSVIKGFSQLMTISGSDLNERTRKMAQLIDRQTLMMQTLVEDFLNLARIEAGLGLELKLTEISDLKEVIDDVVELQQQGLGQRPVRIIAPDAPPTVVADRVKVQEVLSNLVSNAFKYSQSPSMVTVEMTTADGFVRFAVTDQGEGIAPNSAGNLFQRFTRVRGGMAERVPGTGIGLYVSRQIVEAHGGRIWLESTPGRGSTFFFTLPLKPESGAAAVPAQTPAEARADV
jgi:signal transduction histidine kinase/CHASE2 domain-containing sensor protein